MLTENLIGKSFDYLDKHKENDFVVKPSIPIIYFGNLSAYKISQLKVVTVGKNPSDNEFRQKKNESFSFFRFKKWNPQNPNLIETLNHYFMDEPLKQWFSSYEPILNGLDCSFYGNYTNTALHTDICSPIATFPTWSNLGSNQDLLFEEGFQLWKELIEELEPDLILISLPFVLYKKIAEGEDIELLSFDDTKNGKRKTPYKVYSNIYYLKSGKRVKMIFGRAAQKPFDKITNDQKNQIGQKCLK